MPTSQSEVKIITKEAVTELARLTAALEKNKQAVLAEIAAEGKLAKGDAERAVNKLAKETEKAASAQRKLGSQVSQTLEAFVRYNIVNQIFNRITRGIRDSISAAKELELSVARAQTLGSGQLNSQQLQGQVLDISDDFGIDAAKVADAVYTSLSNRVGNTAESLKFVSQQAKFAEATFIDLGSAVNLSSGILNAYGQTVHATTRINDELFRAIELGRLTAEDLEKNLGSVIGPAADLGIQLDELLVSVDQLSLSGVPITRAFTGIRNVIFSVLKPSDDLAAALKQIGASSVEAAISQRGLLGTVAALAGTTTGLSSEIAKLFPNIRAFAASGPLIRAAGGALDEFSTGLEGASDRAQALVRATEAKTLERNLNEFRNVFTTDVGKPIVTALNAVFESFVSAETAGKSLAVVLNTLAPAVAVLVAGFSATTIFRFAAAIAFANVPLAAQAKRVRELSLAYNISAASAANLITVQAALNTVLIGFAIGAAIGSLINELRTASNSMDELRTNTDKVRQSLDKITADKFRALNGEVEKNIKNLQRQRQEVFKILNEQDQAYQRSAELVRAGQEAVTESLRGQLQERNQIVAKFLNSIINASERAEKNIRSALDVARSLQRSVSDSRFNEQLNRTQDPAERARLLQRRAEQLLAAARRAENAGETGESDQLQRDAVEAANQILSLQGQTSIAVGTQNRVLAEANKIQSARIKTEENIARLGREQSGNASVQLTELTQLEKKLDVLQKQREVGTPIQVEAAEKEIQQVSTRYQELLREVADNPLASRLLNQQELAKLTSTFFNVLADDIKGQEVSLNVLLDANVKNFRDQTQAALDAARPVSLQTQLELLTGVKANVQGFAAQDKVLADLGNQSDQDLRARQELAQKQEELTNAIEALTAQAKAQALALIPETPTGRGQGGLSNVVAGFKDVLTGFKVATGSSVSPEEAAEGAKAVNEVLATLASGNFDQALIQANNVPESFREIGTAIAAEIVNLQRRKKAIDDLNVSAQEGTKRIEGLNSIIRGLGLNQTEVTSPIRVQTAEEFTAGAADIKDSGTTFKDAVNTFNKAVDKIGRGSTRAGGGRIFRAGGGGVGTDTIPAMLSPNEFVVNATAARKWHAQLIAMNGGMDPKLYRAGGGDVTNNISVGDVVVNNSGGKVDGAMIAQELRRGLRRGKIKI